MGRQEKWLVAIFGALFIIGILLVVNLWATLNASRPMQMMPMLGMMNSNVSGTFASNGERIFRTGTNAQGAAIGNSMMMGMGGCVMCHGPDGHGGQMMGRAEPCNTFKCLSAAGYTEESIKQSVTQGIGADGRQ
ncbi:MAG TPA: hypothetical protein VFD70_05460, partial [Anaerolineae bacterium]|nr:hypothetical protein [Anaerolineae bacterium]